MLSQPDRFNGAAAPTPTSEVFPATAARASLFPAPATPAIPREMLAALDGLPERVRVIALLRGFGFPFKAIGRLLGVRPQAASIMLHRHWRALAGLQGSYELHGLSARAINALGRYSIRSRAQARRRNVLALLRGKPNCGRRTLHEIARWMEQSGSRPGSLLAENGFAVAGMGREFGPCPP